MGIAYGENHYLQSINKYGHIHNPNVSPNTNTCGRYASARGPWLHAECMVTGTSLTYCHTLYAVGFDSQQTDRQQAEGNSPAGTNQI